MHSGAACLRNVTTMQGDELVAGKVPATEVAEVEKWLCPAQTAIGTGAVLFTLFSNTASDDALSEPHHDARPQAQALC